MEDRKDGIQVLETVVDIVRKLAFLAMGAIFFVAIVYSPEQVAKRIHVLGITELPGGWKFSADEARKQNETLVNAANALAGAGSQAQNDPALKRAGDLLTSALSQQMQVLEKVAPTALPRSGWAFLGTRSLDGTRWLTSSKYYVTIDPVWPINVGTTVTFRTDTNLHSDSAPDDRPRARILGVVPAGASAVVKDLDMGREFKGPDGQAPPGYPEPGRLVWARVETR